MQALFQTAILNDTLFLNIVNIVDYSIVVGLDEERRELVSVVVALLSSILLFVFCGVVSFVRLAVFCCFRCFFADVIVV